MSGAIPTALDVLNSELPADKVKTVFQLHKDWISNKTLGDLIVKVADSPARPRKPELVGPGKVPRRRLGSDHGRAALLHAIAHIELNAIDLACDMIARFTRDPMIADDAKETFVTDWISVAHDEARHFHMLSKRLADIGFCYGDFSAHNGLWEAALATKGNISARIAIAPLVLEARGLDVTPGIINKLTKVNDGDSVAILRIIYEEEIGHVGIGSKWFRYVCDRQNHVPEQFFQELVKKYFKGALKPPFNREARGLAGFPESFYIMES